MAFSITDYNIFETAAATTTDLKNKFSEIKTSITEAKNKLSDETIFSGPIRDACLEEFNILDVDIDARISAFETVSTKLLEVLENYKNGDKEAADKIIDLSSATSIVAQSVGATSAGNSQASEDMINRAMSVLGSSYVGSGYYWTGDTSTSAFTCSGLVDYALGNDPCTNWPQKFSNAIIDSGNWKSDVSELKRGDLVFYYYPNGCGYDNNGNYPGHVGIYLGDGQVLDSANEGVQIRPVDWMTPLGGGTYV